MKKRNLTRREAESLIDALEDPAVRWDPAFHGKLFERAFEINSLNAAKYGARNRSFERYVFVAPFEVACPHPLDYRESVVWWDASE